MWRAAGDTSTDYNFYTKRAILSAVYGALLAFLSDNSTDLAGEAFLDGRLADVAKLPRWQDLPKPWQIWSCVLRVRSCVAAARKLRLCFILTPSPLIFISCSGL